MAVKPGGCPPERDPPTPTPISVGALPGSGVMSSSDPPTSVYSSSESLSSEYTTMREPSRDSAWHPLHVACSEPLLVATFDVTSCSFIVRSPKVFIQIWPPTPCPLVTVDFQ